MTEQPAQSTKRLPEPVSTWYYNGQAGELYALETLNNGRFRVRSGDERTRQFATKAEAEQVLHQCQCRRQNDVENFVTNDLVRQLNEAMDRYVLCGGNSTDVVGIIGLR